MLATPADQVRAEVRRVYAPAPLPPLLQPFDDDPAAAVAALAELVRAYWARALAPHWPRIRALLEGDVLHRARRLADGGAQRLFADIHPELRFADDTLFIDMPFDGHLDLGGRGLLFVPERVHVAAAVRLDRGAVAAVRRLPGARDRLAVGARPRRAAGGARRAARPPPRVGARRAARAALDHRARPRARALARQRLPAPVRAPRRRPRQRPPRRPRGPLRALADRRRARPVSCVMQPHPVPWLHDETTNTHERAERPRADGGDRGRRRAAARLRHDPRHRADAVLRGPRRLRAHARPRAPQSARRRPRRHPLDAARQRHGLRRPHDAGGGRDVHDARARRQVRAPGDRRPGARDGRGERDPRRPPDRDRRGPRASTRTGGSTPTPPRPA